MSKDKTTSIKALRQQLHEAYGLLLDARTLVGPWPEDIAREVDKWTQRYEKQNPRTAPKVPPVAPIQPFDK